MSQNRNMDYLNRKQIIYRTIPQDKPTKIFDWGYYYEDGTNDCYDLFRSRAKITTYKSLKWHLLVLWYLNPTLELKDFKELANMLCYKENEFVTFNISQQMIDKIVQDVYMMDLEYPPKNRLRKIIFDPMCGLDTDEKLKIVGSLVGRSRKVNKYDIYDMMLLLNDQNKKITIAKIAKLCDCTPRTIYRNMGDTLRKEKELLNSEL